MSMDRDAYSHYRMRLDYVDATLYPFWSLKKSLDYVDGSMVRPAFSHCKRNLYHCLDTSINHAGQVTVRTWVVSIGRLTMVFNVKRAKIMLIR